jgi:hypothetical protein
MRFGKFKRGAVTANDQIIASVADMKDSDDEDEFKNVDLTNRDKVA